MFAFISTLFDLKCPTSIKLMNQNQISTSNLSPHTSNSITKQHSSTYLIELPNQDSSFSTTLKRLLRYCISFFISQGKSCNFVPYTKNHILDDLDFLDRNFRVYRYDFVIDEMVFILKMKQILTNWSNLKFDMVGKQMHR